jgi:hypothetical protein
MNEFYVYIHTKTTDNKIFYVGRGKGNRKTVCQNRNDKWKKVVEEFGFFSEIIENNLSLQESIDLEKYWICKFKSDGIELCNLNNGGGGIGGRKRTEQEKQRIRAALIGIPKSEATKAKMIGNTNGKGLRSDEFRAKMSLVMKGKPKSEEHKKKLSAALKNKPKTWFKGL